MSPVPAALARDQIHADTRPAEERKSVATQGRKGTRQWEGGSLTNEGTSIHRAFCLRNHPHCLSLSRSSLAVLFYLG